MALVLKRSTAVDVLIGPFVDRTDGFTAETGESPSVQLSKNGQALAAKNDVTTPVHDANGYYNCELSATDTNSVGQLVLTVAASANALPVRHEFQIVDEPTYNALYQTGPTGFDINGRVDVGEWAGNAVTFGTGGPDVNVNAISDDTAAATNLEADYDGTGFNKSNSTIGTCTTNTDMRGTDNAALATAVAALNDISVVDILAGGDVDGFTVEETLKLVLASVAAKLSGAATTTITIRAADDSKDRITATVDANGNRSAVTLDATG